MALLDKKFNIKNSKGEIQELRMYSEIEDVKQYEHYLELEIINNDKNKVKVFIGMTADINSPDASDMFIFFENKEYRLLK